MKVKIGPYTNWIGPYQIAEKLIWWADKYECTPWSERQYALGEWLAKDKNGDDSWLMRFCTWINGFKKRQEYVHIDDYDVWNMDETLRIIIGPMFKKLKAVKHSFGMIADTDVPEPLQSIYAQPKENEWDCDNLAEARYEWLLDEMIWVFTADHDAAQSQFYDHGEPIKGEDFMAYVRRMKVDIPALDAYNKRVANAYRLFGKYYQTFWD